MPIGKLDYFSDRILPEFVKASRNIILNDKIHFVERNNIGIEGVC